MTGIAIELRGVVYQYPQGSFKLQIDHLALRAGEITIVQGENGSGKSTMAKLMAGVYHPGQGSVILAGQPADTLSLGRIGRMIGYLWQKPEQQLFAHNVLEELLFVGRLNSPAQSLEHREAAEDDARNWLRLFEIEHLAGRSSFFLSRGEKQRVALAAVLHQGARYLILDEPTTGLDQERKRTLSGILAKLNRERSIGMTIISHDAKFAEELAHRSVTLARGEIADARAIAH